MFKAQVPEPGEPLSSDFIEAMGRKLNLTHLSEQECEQILQVIQRDFNLRKQEQDRLQKIEEDVHGETQKSQILGKEKAFNDNNCIRCFSRFVFLFNQKVQCATCQLFVCKKCSVYIDKEKSYVCKVCQQKRELEQQSVGWFYTNIKKKFKRFGSAKVVRSLYKRKVDSESEFETDSGYDPSLYSSLPVGRGSRLSIREYFSNGDAEQKVLAAEANGNGYQPNSQDAVTVDNRNQQVEKLYNSPYTCQVGQTTLEDVRVKETERFRQQMNGISVELQRALDNQSPGGVVLDGTSPACDHVVATYKRHVADALNALSKNMHTAINSQNPVGIPPSQADRDAYVQQILSQEAEEVLGRPLDLQDEFMSSGYISGDSSSRGSLSSQHIHKDAVAKAIVTKIAEDYRHRDIVKHRKEEDFVRRQFTKLSNRATLEQLDDLASGSETDDITSSARNSEFSESFRIEDTDLDSIQSPSEVSDFTGREADVESIISSPRTQKEKENLIPARAASPVLVQNRPEPVTGQTAYNRQESYEDELDALVAANLESDTLLIQGARIHKNTERSASRDTLIQEDILSSPDTSSDVFAVATPEPLTPQVEVLNQKEAAPVAYSRPDQVFNQDLPDHHGEPGVLTEQELEKQFSDIRNALQKESVIDERPSVRSPPVIYVEKVNPLCDSDDTLDVSSVDDDYHHNMSVNHQANSPMESLQTHVTLPEFGESDTDYSRFEVDPDLMTISTRDTMATEGRLEEDLRSERSYSSNTSGFESQWFFKDKISAYDNFGNKRVGKKDVRGPVFMFIPKSQELDESSPKVGDRSAAEMSDLSENESESDEDSLIDDYTGKMMAPGEVTNGNITQVQEVMVQTQEVLTQSSPENLDNRSHGNSTKKVQKKTVSHDQEMNNLNDVTENENLALSPEERQKKIEMKLKNIGGPTIHLEDDDSSEDPKFIVKPPNMDVREGEVARFECKVSGSEPIDVFWYREGIELEQLEEGDRIEVGSEVNHHYLDLFNVTRGDAGQYLCIVVNEKGKCITSVHLKVAENPDEKVAPEFIKGLKDIEVISGQSAKFRCKVKGYPTPRILWYKDGKKINQGDKQYVIEKCGNRDHLLTVEDATIHDDAEYTVVARNIVGECRSRAQLIVEDIPEDKERTPTGDSIIPSPVYETAPVHQKEADDDDLYPDTDSLVALAERVATARTQVSYTAENMLHSASKMSSLEQELDDMDRRLDSVNKEMPGKRPSTHDDRTNNNSSITADTETYRENIIRDHRHMKSAAENVRGVTSSALDVLHSAQSAIKSEHEPSRNDAGGIKRKSDLLSPDAAEGDQLVELRLTYEEYQRLLEGGQITSNQYKLGKVTKNHLTEIEDWLSQNQQSASESGEDMSHDLSISDEYPMSIDCGLKRVDSKRYKRDYKVGGRIPGKKKWEVQTKPAVADEIVMSPEHTNLLNDTEEEEIDDVTSTRLPVLHEAHTESSSENIYMAAGKVYSLEDRIKRLESRVSRVDDEASAKQLEELEDEVARAVAQTEQTERQVVKIENQVSHLQKETSSPQSHLPERRHLDSSTHASPNLPSDRPAPFNVAGRVSSTGANNLDKTDIPDRAASHDAKLSNKDQSSIRDSFTADHTLPSDLDPRDFGHSSDSAEEGYDFPSVSKLKEKFSRSGGTPEQMRVYSSLTARGLPKTLQEKLKNGQGLGKDETKPTIQTPKVARGGSPGGDQPYPRPRGREQAVGRPFRTSTPVVPEESVPVMVSHGNDQSNVSNIESNTSFQGLSSPAPAGKTRITETQKSIGAAQSRPKETGNKVEAKTPFKSILKKRSPSGQEKPVKHQEKSQPIKRQEKTSQPMKAETGGLARPKYVPRDRREAAGKSAQENKSDKRRSLPADLSRVPVQSGQGAKFNERPIDVDVPKPDAKFTPRRSLSHDVQHNKGSATIRQRAAFWDKKIQEGNVHDKEMEEGFPDLPASNFKK